MNIEYPAKLEPKPDPEKLRTDRLPSLFGFDADREMEYGDGEAIRRDNRRRATNAAVAVHAYGARIYGNDGTSVATTMGDLLGDLLHFCDAVGIDYDAAFERALRVYHAELRGTL